MVSLLTCENVLERMHCTEGEKKELMETIDLLCEMNETARQEGYSALHEKYHDRMDDEFFQCAVTLFPRAMSQVPRLREHLANAARVKYPAACCESSLIPRQLAAGYLIG